MHRHTHTDANTRTIAKWQRALGGANRHVIQSVKLKAYIEENEMVRGGQGGGEERCGKQTECVQMLGGRVLLKIDAIKF